MTIVSGLRLQSLIVFAKSSNSTWDYYDVCLWSTIEVTVGVMCTCLPTVRQLLIKICPKLGQSFCTKSSSLYDHRYKTFYRSTTGNVPLTTTTVAADKKEGRSNTESSRHGILVEQTFSVCDNKTSASPVLDASESSAAAG